MPGRNPPRSGYLVLENASRYKHEYLDGLIYAIQGEPVRGMAELQAYQKLDGLQHIILLSSMEEAAWSCQRVPADAAWTTLEAWPAGTRLALDGLGLSLGWDEVYAGVGLR